MARSERYAFADRGYTLTQTIGDAPPDYTFDEGNGQRPWVWRANDGSMRLAEPLSDGGYRYFYYGPGARTPYLIRDSDDSYAFVGGVLVVVYAIGGETLDRGDMSRLAEVAGRLLARGDGLYAASQSEARQAVTRANWAAHKAHIDAGRAQWTAILAEDHDWRAYHVRHEQQN